MKEELGNMESPDQAILREMKREKQPMRFDNFSDQNQRLISSVCVQLDDRGVLCQDIEMKQDYFPIENSYEKLLGSTEQLSESADIIIIEPKILQN